MHFDDNPWKQFKVTMTEKERRGQIEKLVKEMKSYQNAMEAKDPSMARGVYSDKDLNWMCADCPYAQECGKKMQAVGAAA
jgi:CRISPR/Cas system-associated exonuclease Cas4 (RecB family)